MAADPSTAIRDLENSTDSLLRSIAGLADDDVRADSLLPGWSRGHVLTHVARNADAMVNLTVWAATRQVTPMYASRAERDAAIEEQAHRPATELVADVNASSERLLGALARLDDAAWEAPIRFGAEDVAARGSDIPVLRRTEVEIHHVDLGLDYTLAHWPEDFVEMLLSQVAHEISSDPSPPGLLLVANDDEGTWTVGDGSQEVNGPPPALLGWLIGRTDGIGLYSSEPLPRLGGWK